MTALRLAAGSYCLNGNLIGIDGWMNGWMDPLTRSLHAAEWTDK